MTGVCRGYPNSHLRHTRASRKLGELVLGADGLNELRQLIERLLMRAH